MKENNGNEDLSEVDYDKYLVVSGIYEKFAESNIRIRITDSLETMKNQSIAKWIDYFEKLRKEAKKRGQFVTVGFAHIAFHQREIDLFTGFLKRGLPEYDEIVVKEFLAYLKESLDYWTGEKQRSGANEKKSVSSEATDKQDRQCKRSFSWTGSQAQKEALCEALKVNGYIDQRTSKEAFTAIFSGSDINSNLLPVTWICKNRKGTANKTVLREFLTLLKCEFQESTVPVFFIDLNKKPISLNKPKKNEFSNYFSKLEEIINSVNRLLPDH